MSLHELRAETVATLTDEERALALSLANRSMPMCDAIQLIAEVAGIFGITPEDIAGTSRLERIVDARAVVTRVLRARGWTYDAIGEPINRNHSTVINLERRLNAHLNLQRLADAVA